MNQAKSSQTHVRVSLFQRIRSTSFPKVAVAADSALQNVDADYTEALQGSLKATLKEV